MKRTLIILALTLLINKLDGQVNRFGVPVIKNYSTQITGGSEQNWCIVKDKAGNLYFGNNDRGVLRYDGTKWTTINIGKNPRIYSLASDDRGLIYVGAAFEFGYIQADLKGRPQFVSLASRVDSLPEIRLITNIAIQNDRVLFLSPKFIYTYDVTKDSLSKINLKNYNLNEALRLVKINDKLILSDNNEGLFELSGKSIKPLPGGSFFKKMNCTFILPYDKSRVLIGTFFDGLYLYDYRSGVVKTFVSDELNEKLKSVMVYAGTEISDDLFAIGTTQEQGVLILNRDGEVIQRIDNENSSLEDITIYAMYCDYENGSELWVSTLGYISKAYFNLPVTHFSEKNGIDAGINSINEIDGHIFLASDAGLMMSAVEDNTVAFRKISEANTQIFPLAKIKNASGDFLLAGSINGLLQVKEEKVSRIETKLKNLPKGASGRYNVKKILQSETNPDVIYAGLENGGIIMLKYSDNNWSYYGSIDKIPGYINGIVEDGNKGLWFITDDPNGLYYAKFSLEDTVVIKFGSDKGVSASEINSIQKIGHDLYITTSKGIQKYDESIGKFLDDNSLTDNYSAGKNSTGLFADTDGDIWFSGTDKSVKEMLFRKEGNKYKSEAGFLNLLPNVPQMDIMVSEEKAYMLKSNSLFVIDKQKIHPDTSKVKSYFVRIVAGSDSVVMEGSFFETSADGKRIPVMSSSSQLVPEFSYDMNKVSFEWTTPSYTEELLTEYSYMLEGYEKNWSEWEGISYGNTMEAQYFRKEYANLPYGTYTFHVRTRTLTGLEGNNLTYRFVILKPWYATIVAFIGFVLIGALFIYVILKAYTRKLKNENLRLEGIVAERTAVVVKQKEELESSIHYASRIQMALLPSEAILAENIRNYFILFKPRDIVSGDFYWMTKKENRLYIVAADCTGHGVPGAFMSILGMSFLDEIIDKDNALKADRILSQLRLHVIESLKQTGSDDESKDGMDMALLVVDFGSKLIEFSGAYNPCFMVRKMDEKEILKYKNDGTEMKDGTMTNGTYILETINANKMPIGISSRMNEEFTYNEWKFQKGVSYYLFSDGYLDQFGGPDGRKFMKKNFKKLILDIQDYPLSRQKDILDMRIREWMGQSPQIDDILVLGIRPE
jgi:serine phosphatase RsbU (regulator of sigma subunit)